MGNSAPFLTLRLGGRDADCARNAAPPRAFWGKRRRAAGIGRSARICAPYRICASVFLRSGKFSKPRKVPGRPPLLFEKGANGKVRAD
ncbi:MAG: hypothetical protein BHW65_02680 [Verrucomicrobia bacterium CAG:312_58_20]|nr:MAG: hypothetical protein BHW65_02680 [Verrucomicrobia bacterium CAG:312_58_20]